LDDRAGLRAFIKDLGLAFVNLATTGHGHFLRIKGPKNTQPRRTKTDSSRDAGALG
jgi:hypothetical protein